jgi:plasmid maintenance system killer protein
MEVSTWVAEHWLDLLQSIGIVGGLYFTAYTTRKDERARRIGNSIAINEQYRQIWKELFDHPELGRILKADVDLKKHPVVVQEELFVNMLILHLSTVYRAMEHDEFVKLEGLRADVTGFFTLPIPKVVWEKLKALQDGDFVAFIHSCLNSPIPKES